LARRAFKLSARISGDNPPAIFPVIKKFIGVKGAIKQVEDGYEVQADLEGENARALNRMLLSELRKAEKRTRIRAEWISGNTIERFFDYVPKGTRKLQRHRSS
jgi:acylphosphatase